MDLKNVKYNMISSMPEEYINIITDMHLNCFKDDFITSLGKYFLKNVYYRGIFDSGLGFGFICKIDNKVAGFIIGSYDSKRLQKQYIKRYWHKILLCLLLKVISDPMSMVEIMKGFFIMGKKYPDSNVGAELLSLAVHPSCREKGIATNLVNKFKEHLKISRVDRCFTMTHSPIAKKIYEKAGFKKECSFEQNGKELDFLIYDAK